ncbi:hypothetical protein EYF80_049151 [Liparis tanakae]|uniref:Secreted protein n=1 Tax=Liparis tanakae TaxID=230148 RepID=A0A4Z2FK80_9TELE|nr:hypothetical protein EYF80_049151 [Liparis tanakae]
MWSLRATFSKSAFLLCSAAISRSSSATRPSARRSVCRCFSSSAETSSACVFWMERTSSDTTRELSSTSLRALAWMNKRSRGQEVKTHECIYVYNSSRRRSCFGHMRSSMLATGAISLCLEVRHTRQDLTACGLPPPSPSPRQTSHSTSSQGGGDGVEEGGGGGVGGEV